MTKSNPIQFGIGRLMVVTTLVAFCMAISIRFDSPTVAQGFFAVYLMLGPLSHDLKNATISMARHLHDPSPQRKKFPICISTFSV